MNEFYYIANAVDNVWDRRRPLTLVEYQIKGTGFETLAAHHR
jgi:hypothetical protein